jgi:hypothetical protein
VGHQVLGGQLIPPSHGMGGWVGGAGSRPVAGCGVTAGGWGWDLGSLSQLVANPSPAQARTYCYPPHCSPLLLAQGVNFLLAPYSLLDRLEMWVGPNDILLIHRRQRRTKTFEIVDDFLRNRNWPCHFAFEIGVKGCKDGLAADWT